ncbi:MAG: hypothetical protein JOZ84_17660 [Methylobacteriaceae bacterium]|nr:hypothetical protein [Methylobacteriaceae bacterium]MBV9396223.1 hypothetical protein [Methylobacteriaceae bacterium]
MGGFASGVPNARSIRVSNKGSLSRLAELSKAWRDDNIEGNIENPPKPVLINDQSSKREAHVAQEIPDEEIAAIAHYVAHFK